MTSDADDPSADERTRAEHVTRLLASAEGDPREAAALLPLVYDELRELARARLRRELGARTLQATALVHEAYLRLVGERDPGWNGRGHFFGAAALAMRRILVEQARRRARLRHGGGRQRVDVDDVEPEVLGPDPRVLEVEEALCRLEELDPRKGRLVSLRYFAGLSNEETAAALGVSVGTVERDWRFVKAWLADALGDHAPEAPGP